MAVEKNNIQGESCMKDKLGTIQEEYRMYTEKVMDHFEHPRNVGEIENPSGMGTVGNSQMRRYHADLPGY